MSKSPQDVLRLLESFARVFPQHCAELELAIRAVTEMCFDSTPHPHQHRVPDARQDYCDGIPALPTVQFEAKKVRPREAAGRLDWCGPTTRDDDPERCE